MDFHAIVDDVWTEIFQEIDDPRTLCALTRTCHRFYLLARRDLLREIRWMKPQSTQRNLDAWSSNSFYQTAHAVPRKLMLGIGFESAMKNAHLNTPEALLHDRIWAYLPRFTSLNELVLDGATLSLYVYTVLTQMPSLRSLTITKCTYIQLHTPMTPMARVHQNHNNPASFPFATLPLTHLSLQEIAAINVQSLVSHPLNLLSSSSLTSLSIRWTPAIATMYARDVSRYALPSLTELVASMPVLTRNLIDSLVHFVEGCTLVPSVKLTIHRLDISDQQITTILAPLRNVCFYEGPLPISAFGRSYHEVRNKGANSALRVVKANYPIDLTGLLESMERLTSGIEKLEVMVREWDLEILFAIRQLFPVIQELVIRYGKGTFSSDFSVTLGSSILFDLPQLTTFKLFYDPNCVLPTRQPRPVTINHLGQLQTMGDDDLSGDSYDEQEEAGSSDPPPFSTGIEHGDLEDYLIGWNKHCKRLRHVQVRKDIGWKRRFEGDAWKEVVCDEGGGN